MRFDCWIRSHCWDLAQDDWQFDSARRWPVVVPSLFHHLRRIPASCGDAGLMLLSQDEAHPSTHSFAAQRQSTRMLFVPMRSRSRSSGIVSDCSLRSSWLCRKNDYNVLICFEWVKRTGEACIQSDMLCCCILSSLFLIPKMTLKNFKAETRVGRLLSGEDLIIVKVTRGGFSFFFCFQ